MSTTRDSQIFAEMIVVGDEFMDSGVRRTVNSVSRSENWTTVVCSDGTLIRAANSRRIEILNPRITVRPPFTGAERSAAPASQPPQQRPVTPATPPTPETTPPAKGSETPAPQSPQVTPEATSIDGSSAAHTDSPDSADAHTHELKSQPSDTKSNPASRASAPSSPGKPAFGFEGERSSAATNQLATITTVVEYILWGLLGLTILGSAIAATRTQSSICGETLASATTCESYPYIIPSIAAAVIATAFYLFGIAIMRAIRLWAQRLAAGLPV